MPYNVSPPTIRERLGAARYLIRLASEVWKTSPPLMSVSLGLRLAIAFQPLLTFYIGKLIVDEVVALGHTTGPDIDLWACLRSGQLTRLGEYISLEFAIAFCADLLTRIIALTDSFLSEKHNNRVSIALMLHAASLDLAHFEDSEHQDQLNRARNQAGWSSNFLSHVLGQFESLITLTTLLSVLASYAPVLILFLMIALIPAVWNEFRFNTLNYQLEYSRAEERRLLDYLRHIGINAETAKEIKLFGLADFLLERFAKISETFYTVNKSMALRRALWSSAFVTLSTCAYYFSYAIIIWKTLIGAFSLGDLTFLTGSFLRLRGLVQGLLFNLAWLSARALELRDLFNFFDIKPNIVSPENALLFPKIDRLGICFEDVGFRYPGSDKWAVRHLTFTLHASEALALVGENGAGKTTIVKLLTRLYDPDEGRILIEGVDIKTLDLSDLRRQIGVVFQDFTRYDFTVRENIAVGRIENLNDRQKIETAAEKSLASVVINNLPQRYDQPLGKRFKEGRDLSGGEWQKIALARAYMREANCLILDEPTSAIDARAEAQFLSASRRFAKAARLFSFRIGFQPCASPIEF